MPTDARSFTGARIMPSGDQQWEDYRATVYFWVRKSRLAARTDRALLDALRAWIADDWSLGTPLFVTNEQFTQQVELIEGAGLRLRFEIEEPGKPGRYRAYE
jgi:hypothetical protein